MSRSMHDAQRCLLAAIAITVAGCSDDDDRSRDLYDEAIAGDAYKSWSRFPGAPPDLSKSVTHNGDYVRSYMNPVAVDALVNFSGRFPDGAILVKEQYADPDGKTLNGHAVMWKIAGFDPDHGDWYWVAFDGEGRTTEHEGRASYCFNCHKSVADHDWVYTAFN